MSYVPKVVPQLGHDGEWGPYDCWNASTRGLYDFASGGRLHIDPETSRKRSGKWVANPSHADLERLGPGELEDIARILRHPDTVAEFAKAGLKPPKARILGITKAATVLTYLAKGYQAAVAIHYGTLRELRPRQSGSTTFGGNHSTRWYGDYEANGKPQELTASPLFSDQLDPLCDGRRPGIAKGPQRLNRKTLLAIAAAVELHDSAGKVIGHVGKGRVMALVVKPAEHLLDQQDPPPPPPDDPCADSEDEIARLQGVIRTIGAAITDVPQAMNTIAQIVSDPANSGGIDQ